jgi:hypothetical protein
MNVDISWYELVADRVWFDASCGKLFIQAGEFVNGIPFDQIPDEDFESATPVRSFGIGQSGSVIVCHHKDDKETWLPVDMWLPHGFAPPK